jgi:hypothetical protein
MAHAYEVTAPMPDRALFELAFVRYLESLGYHHMSVGGWSGGKNSHEFRRGDDIVGLSIVSEGQSDCGIVVQSETVEIEPLIVDVLTEGVADSLQAFGDALDLGEAKAKVQSLIKILRDAFPEHLTA